MELGGQFEELMQRSPIPQHEMTIFLREMRRTPSGTVAVSKLLAAKIQSASEAQAIHAFEFLEAALESETEGSIEFRTEIGRYRFLNEIIRILSPKYLGDKTSEAVKERAIKFLEDAAGAKRKRWFPSEHSKVNSVYQSLVESGIIQKPARVADEDAEFQKSIFERGENAVILKRLLQSKDPSDLQAANRLIKNLVDEEARRNERRAELHSLIDRIETSTSLLTEMLSQPNIDKEIVDDLVDTCRSLRQKLGGVATETNDEATSLLQASENIEQVLLLYDLKKEYIAKVANNLLESSASGATTANGSAPGNSETTELSLADQLLMNLGDDKIIGVIQKTQQKNKVLDDGDNLLLNLDIDFTPTPTPPKAELDANKNEPKLVPLEPFDEISKLSKEMMEQGLKGIPAQQAKKTDKTPLSQIKRSLQEIRTEPSPQQESVTVSHPIPQNSRSDSMTLLDLDFLEESSSNAGNATSKSSSNLNSETMTKPTKSLDQPKASSRQHSSNEDENLLLVLENDKSTPGNNHSNGMNNNSNNQQSTNTHKLQQEEKGNGNGLTSKNTSCVDSSFSLNSVRELDLENIDLIEDVKPVELNIEETCKDVSLTLTFGKYPGLPHFVNVAVVTLTNRNKGTGLLNYVFQLMPPKGLQVKLLPPACMELPPWKKTFLPPPLLTQVALIKVPSGSASVKTQIQPKIRYILSYCVEDDTMLHNGDFLIPSSLLQ